MNKTFSTEDVIFKICIITALAVVMIARDLLLPLAALLLCSRRRPHAKSLDCGDTPAAERRDALAQMRSGDLDVLVSADLYIAGLDLPVDTDDFSPYKDLPPVKFNFNSRWPRLRSAKMETLRQQAESLGIDTDDFPFYEDLLEAVLENLEALVSANDDYSSEVLTAEQRSPHLLP